MAFAAKNLSAQTSHRSSDGLSLTEAQQQHVNTVKPRAARMHGQTVTADSRAVTSGSRSVTEGSQASGTAGNSVAREAIREAMRMTGLTQKAMAITAGVQESHLSAALTGSRNFEIDWLLAQDAGVIVAFIGSVQSQLGLTAESRASIRAQRIGELVQLLSEGA